MKLVVIESPFAAANLDEQRNNIDYARKCMRHSLMRGEAPFASHLIYPQANILNDNIASERQLGIEAGYSWGSFADLHAFYTDRGWSPGMIQALRRLEADHTRDLKVEFRALYGTPCDPPPADLDLRAIESTARTIVAMTCEEGGKWHKPAAIKFSDGRIWDYVLNSWRPA